MTTVQEIVDAAQQLSPVEQLKIITSLSHALEQQYTHVVSVTDGPARRIAGLDAGKVWMSDDFDAPLPDAFWLGGDDELVR